MGNHRNPEFFNFVGKQIGNQKVLNVNYINGKAHFEVFCAVCTLTRNVKSSDLFLMNGKYCNNCFSFEKFKQNFYKKFPDSPLKLLKKDKTKIIVKDYYGYCRIEFKNLIKNGSVSILNAIYPTEYFKNKIKYLVKEHLDTKQVVYVDAHSKINLRCFKHGKFITSVNNINQGLGCFKCSQEKIKTSKFKRSAKLIHGNTYNYSKTIVSNTTSKVVITCKIHGDFYQLPHNHLKGNRCPKCGILSSIEKQKSNFNIRSYTGWEKTSKKSKNFDSYKVYIVKVFNDREQFYKIGKTFTTIENRFLKEIKLGYKFEPLKIIEGSAIYVSTLEKILHERHKNYFYTPLIKFKGMYECFSKIDINEIELIT